MSKRSSSSVARLLIHSADIAAYTPLIASKRIGRLSRQDPARAAASLGGMGVEKFAAFGSAWIGMTAAAAQAHMQLAFSMVPKFGVSRKTVPAVMGKRAFDLGSAVLSGGIRPIHAQVKRNARSKK